MVDPNDVKETTEDLSDDVFENSDEGSGFQEENVATVTDDAEMNQVLTNREKKRQKKAEKAKEKKAKAEKRKVEREQRKKDKDNIIGGIFGDRDKRTKRSVSTTLFTLLAFLLLTVGSVWFFIGNHNYKQYLATNTTPQNTTLTFSRSQDDVQLKDFWIDKDARVGVAHLRYSDRAKQNLSMIGQSYQVYLSDTGRNKLNDNLTVQFGFLGTDGDAYLIMKGNLKAKPYLFYINQPVQLDTQNDTGTNDIMNIQDTQTVTSALSQFDVKDLDDSGRVDQAKIEEAEGMEQMNWISFRVNPISDSTKVAPKSFTDTEGDINYNTLVDTVAVQPAVGQLYNQVWNRLDQKKILQDRYNENLQRIQTNPNDQNARQALPDIQQQQDQLDTEIDTIIRQMKFLSSETFGQDSFGDMTTSFTVIGN